MNQIAFNGELGFGSPRPPRQTHYGSIELYDVVSNRNRRQQEHGSEKHVMMATVLSADSLVYVSSPLIGNQAASKHGPLSLEHQHVGAAPFLSKKWNRLQRENDPLRTDWDIVEEEMQPFLKRQFPIYSVRRSDSKGKDNTISSLD